MSSHLIAPRIAALESPRKAAGRCCPECGYSLRGLPESWWTIAPAVAYLVPFGSGGTYEQEIEIHLHPPRSATPATTAVPAAFAAEERR